MGENPDPGATAPRAATAPTIPLSLERNSMLSTPWVRAMTDAGTTPAAVVPAAIFIAGGMTERDNADGTAASAADRPAVKSPAVGASPRPIEPTAQPRPRRDNRARTVPCAQPSRRAAAAVVRPSR